MNLIKNIQSNSRALALIDQAFFSGTSFVGTLAAARLLSPEIFGIFSAFTLCSYLLISVVNALVIQPFQVSYAGSEDPGGYRMFILSLQLAATAVVLSVGAIVCSLHVNIFGQVGVYLFPACAAMGALLLHDFFRKALLAQNKTFHAVIMDAGMSVLQLGGLGVAFYMSLHDLTSLLWIQALSFGVPALYGAARYGTDGSGFSWKRHMPAQLTQAKWLLATAFIQWWSGNLFVVTAGVFLGPVALGAFRLSQSLFGVLNMILQTYENHALPEAVRRYQVSAKASKAYLRGLTVQGAIGFSIAVAPLLLFPEALMRLVGGEAYLPYAFVLRGMGLLYLVIVIGYPVRLAIRMLAANHTFFLGYLLTFIFSVVTFNVLLKAWGLQGALAGLIANQVILIAFWNYGLIRKNFSLWR